MCMCVCVGGGGVKSFVRPVLRKVLDILQILKPPSDQKGVKTRKDIFMYSMMKCYQFSGHGLICSKVCRVINRAVSMLYCCGSLITHSAIYMYTFVALMSR